MRLTDARAIELEELMATMAEDAGRGRPPLLVGRDLRPRLVESVWVYTLPGLLTNGRVDLSKLKLEWAMLSKMVSHYWVVLHHLSGGELRSVCVSPIDAVDVIVNRFAREAVLRDR